MCIVVFLRELVNHLQRYMHPNSTEKSYKTVCLFFLEWNYATYSKI